MPGLVGVVARGCTFLDRLSRFFATHSWNSATPVNPDAQSTELPATATPNRTFKRRVTDTSNNSSGPTEAPKRTFKRPGAAGGAPQRTFKKQSTEGGQNPPRRVFRRQMSHSGNTMSVEPRTFTRNADSPNSDLTGLDIGSKGILQVNGKERWRYSLINITRTCSLYNVCYGCNLIETRHG